MMDRLYDTGMAALDMLYDSVGLKPRVRLGIGLAAIVFAGILAYSALKAGPDEHFTPRARPVQQRTPAEIEIHRVELA